MANKFNQHWQIVKLPHLSAMFDVVFGVVIGIPLLGLPNVVIPIYEALLKGTTLEQRFLLCLAPCVPFFMLLSAFVFCFYYWLENRHFISEEIEFNKAVEEVAGTGGEWASLFEFKPTFILGGLLMIMLAAASLKLAETNHFRSFLIVNILFWILDFIGTKMNIDNYKAEHLRKAVGELKDKHWGERGWFWGHIGTSYFPAYGVGSAVWFGLILILDYVFAKANWYRCTFAFLMIVFNIIRHAYWRSTRYNSWLERKYGPRCENK